MTGHIQAGVLKAFIAEAHNLDMDVIVHESIDSTNSWSLQQCKLGKVLPFACFAEHQTSGKGRRGKQWLMAARTNIAMSLSWSYAVSHQQLQILPLSVALAIARTLEALSLEHVQIKWPNDVYVQGKKIAGILIETQPIKTKPPDKEVIGSDAADMNQTAVVIGVGLNYDMSLLASKKVKGSSEVFPEMTDIKHEMARQKKQHKFDREFVAAILLQDVVGVCQDFPQNAMQNLEEFRSRFDYCKNKKVDILLDNQETLSALATGVNDAAELVALVDGVECAFNSAEVSVKAGKQ